MRKLLGSLFAGVLLATVVFAFAPAASADTTLLCARMVTAVVHVTDPQSLPPNTPIFQCSVVPE
jgi:hypothetical protein